MKKVLYNISSNGIDAYLWDVRKTLWPVLGVDRGDAAVSPLHYYIMTGRASSEFLHKLIEVSPTKIAKVILGGGSDEEVINRIGKTIKYRRA